MRPALGVAWDVRGNGKTAVRAGIGQFFLRERLTPGSSIAGNPPFVRTLSGNRKLDTTAEPCDGCFGSSLGAPARGREVDMRTPNNWQWNLTFQHEVWRQLHAGGGLRRQLRLQPAQDLSRTRS